MQAYLKNKRVFLKKGTGNAKILKIGNYLEGRGGKIFCGASRELLPARSVLSDTD